MIPFEEIKKYLPQHLSSTAQQELFNELRAFPYNIDQRIYTTYLRNHTNLFQGDGIKNLLYINFPSTNVGQVPGMILSNTCDIDQANKRLMPLRMVYAPIINLGKYEQSLIKNHVDTGQRSIESINSHFADVRKQHISHIFYLPKGGQLENNSIVFFDRINNCPSNLLDKESVIRQRIFTLSNYGFYLFLFKLSVHFTRIRDGVSRTMH